MKQEELDMRENEFGAKQAVLFFHPRRAALLRLRAECGDDAAEFRDRIQHLASSEI
jgi:peroxiredoxin